MFPSLDTDYEPSTVTVARSAHLVQRVTDEQELWHAARRSLERYVEDCDDLDIDREYAKAAEERYDCAVSDLVAFLEEHGL